MIRYAAYLDYINKIEAGIPQERIGYGGSVPEIVNAISDAEDRAALLARDLLGDYGAISFNGRRLRRGWMPFFSWMEINTRRYWRFTSNAFRYSFARGVVTGTTLGVKKSVGIGITLYLRMMLVTALINLWNYIMFPDEEDKLEAAQRMQLHVILGGGDTVESIRLSGALADVIGFFGLGDAAEAIDMAQKDQISGWEAALRVATAPFKATINKIVAGLNPFPKLAVETASGQQYWPDVFEPYPIRDKWRHMFKTFSIENEADLAQNVASLIFPSVDPAPTRGYLNSLAETVIYRRDAGEIAYNNVRRMVADFEKRRTGSDGSGTFSTENSRLLYHWRTALRYGDKEAADKLYDRLINLRDIDGRRVNTPKELRASIERAHPLGALRKQDRWRFLSQLSDDERQEVADAEKWYYETFF